MKTKVLLLALAGMLLFAGTAQAYWRIPFPQARKYSKEFARETCEGSGPSCIWWKVGHCSRISEQRVDCAAATAYRNEVVCGFVVENRVGKYGNGRVHQRRRHLDCR